MWKSFENVVLQTSEKVSWGKKAESLKIYKNGYLGQLGVTQGHWQCHHY